LIRRAYTEVQSRLGLALYDETASFLGTLISRTPFAAFRKHVLPDGFSLAYAGRRRGICSYTRHLILYNLESSLQFSWMHTPWWLYCFGYLPGAFEVLHAQSPHPVLDEQFLFCKPYLDDLLSVCLVGYSFMFRFNGDTILQQVRVVENQLGSGVFGKRGIQSILEEVLRRDSAQWHRDTVTSETFMSLFKLPGWMKMWAPAEFGWWFSIGLSYYGPKGVSELIDTIYPTKRESSHVAISRCT